MKNLFVILVLWLQSSVTLALNQRLAPTIPVQRPPLQQYVMMPLAPIQDWQAFRQGIRTLKNLGVSGVTTDICWGLVEGSEGVFDWSYYQTLGQLLQKERMAWVTVLSTHAIGGNVGDDVDIPLPSYIWDQIPGAEYMYRGGQRNRETISYFAEPAKTDFVLSRFYQSFKQNIYDQFKHNIAKIYIGLGPASEARYPSYAPAIGYVYPGEGEFPIYSPQALESFQGFLKRRYIDIESLSRAWELPFASFDQEQSPRFPQESAAEFIKNARHSRYFRDVMDWYNHSLLLGIQERLKTVSRVFLGHAHGPLGELFAIKVAGIHWQRLNPAIPRGPELVAGYESYDPLFFVAREWQLGVTFTCLEMECGPDSGYPRYSDPPGLVTEIVDSAKRMEVAISGENALEFGHDEPLRTVRRLVDSQDPNMAFHAFTFLRWRQLIDGQGNATAFAHSYRDILVRPVHLKVEYVSVASQMDWDVKGLGLFLVPVNPKNLAWHWDKRVPLKADSESNIFKGEWSLVDPEAQYFAMGAVDNVAGSLIRLSFPQPLKSVLRPMSASTNVLVLNSLFPVPVWPPELDERSQFGEILSLNRSLKNCSELLNRPLSAYEKMTEESFRRQQAIEALGN